MNMPPCTLTQREDICIAHIDELKLEGRGSDPNQAFAALQAEFQRLKMAHDQAGSGPLLLKEGIGRNSPPPQANTRSLGGTALYAMVATLAVLITVAAVVGLGGLAISKSFAPLDPVMALKQSLGKVVTHAEGLTPEGAAQLKRNVRILVEKATPVAAELRPLVGALTPSCPLTQQIKP